MDISNISILIIPLGATAIQSGIKIKESHSNFVTKFSNGSFYSLLAIILAYMKIMSFDNLIVKPFGSTTMTGWSFASCFFVLLTVLLFINFIVVDQVKNKYWRCSISAFLLLIAIIPSYLIVFYNYYLI